jgi:hypothetical protein
MTCDMMISAQYYAVSRVLVSVSLPGFAKQSRNHNGLANVGQGGNNTFPSDEQCRTLAVPLSEFDLASFTTRNLTSLVFIERGPKNQDAPGISYLYISTLA